MYTIIEFTTTRFVDGKFMSRVTILVDTSAEIPTPDEAWEPGSICMIADTHTCKVLNNEREWA